MLIIIIIIIEERFVSSKEKKKNRVLLLLFTMPTVDPKPNHRPFRRVLYREDSNDSTVIQDVSPRSDGHLVTKLKKESGRESIENNHIMVMTNASRKLLMKEGILYKAPAQQIKYVKRVRNDPMARYLFQMKKFSNSSLATFSYRETHSLV
jgi:hypothetical protein